MKHDKNSGSRGASGARGIRRWARRLVWCAAALAGVVVAVYAGFDAASRVRLGRARAALQADRRPLAVDAVLPPAVPAPANAAPLYRSAFALLKAEKIQRDDLLLYIATWQSRLAAGAAPEGVAAELSERFREPGVVKAQSVIERAVEKPSCRFDADFSKGGRTVLPHLAEMRDVSRYLSVRSAVERVQGEAARAWADAVLAIRVSDALHGEPILISQYLREAQIQYALDGLPSLCRATPPGSGDAVAADMALRRLDDPAPLVRAIDGDRLLLGEWTLAQPAAERIRWIAQMADARRQPLPATLPMWLPPLVRLDHAEYLDAMRGYAHAAALPYCEALATPVLRGEIDVPRYCVFTRVVGPAYAGALRRHAALLAQVRVARAGVALARYRRETGAYPAALTEIARLVPIAELTDPFDGQTLRYRADASGAVVYSVGENAMDDGGRPAPLPWELDRMTGEELDAKAWDIVFPCGR